MFYRILKILGFLLLKIMFRIEYNGVEKIPETGALIIAGNHSSYLDGIILGAMSKRSIHFMAKKELFKNKFLASFFRTLKAFPVDREKPGKSSISMALKILKNGNILGIFPEGTRYIESLGKPFYGVGFFSIKSGVPILPVAIHGPSKIAPKGKYIPRFLKIRVTVGDLILPPKVYNKKSMKNLIKDITYQTMNQLEMMLKDLGEERR